MSVIIVDNFDKWFESEEKSVNVRLARKAADISRLSKAYAPVLTGELRSSHRVEKTANGYDVTVNTPYARRRHFENRKNPNTKQYLKRAGDTITRGEL